MPRWIGDNLKGSEFAKLRSKVVTVWMLGTVALGYFLIRYGAPTQRKGIREGWYEDDKDFVEQRGYMRLQLQQLPVKRHERRDIETSQDHIKKLEAQDEPMFDLSRFWNKKN